GLALPGGVPYRIFSSAAGRCIETAYQIEKGCIARGADTRVNQVVAHPVAEYAAELLDLDYYPPVFTLRSGTQGTTTFTDEEGTAWRAYVSELDNGWGVIVQQQEQELFGTLRSLQQASWILVAVGSVILAALTVLTIRQVIRPVGTLTETATAIASGNLDREAPVESEDEIGALAQAFNSMTQQLRSLIGSLEHQVEERTAELAQRSSYLEATADVGRAVASILDPEQMMHEMVELIRQRFGLYYVGLFLVDPAREWAVLRAGTGQAGQTMLAREHHIRVGEGMIGWSVAHSQSRVASEVGKDATRLATEELPDTRSEAALPLRSRGQVLGALTVQDTKPGAFDPATLAVLQTMADQMAVALDNAQLLARSQMALEAERRAYGELERQAWAELLKSREGQGYRYTQRVVTDAKGEWRPEMRQAQQTGQIVQSNGGEGTTLAIPIKLRDQVVGILRLNKGKSSAPWSQNEITLLEELTLQLGVALEGARLYSDTQRRAAQERMMGELTARMRESLDVDMVLRTAVREMRDALGIAEVEVHLTAEEM
ncbi:MAG: GAF domain-containing protein, partial [Anaerolineae bacterium]